MAEVYKGLTIRIGADTSGAAKELKSLESVLKRTGKQAKAMEAALKLDPESMGAASEKARIFSNRIGELAEKMRHLRQLQADAQGGMGRFADAMHDVSRSLAAATKGYNETNDKLAALNREFVAVGLSSKEFLAFMKDSFGIKGEIEDVEQLARAMNELGVTEREFRQGVKGQSAANEKMAEMALTSEGLIERYRQLVREHHEWLAVLDEAKAATVFQEAEVDMKAVSAQQRALVSEAVELDTKFKRIVADTREIDVAAAGLRESFQASNKAVKAGVNDVETFKEMMRLSCELVATLDERAAKLEESLKEIARSGNPFLRMGLSDLEKGLTESTDAAEGLQARLSAVKTRMGELAGQNGGMLSDEYKRLAEELSALSAEYETAIRRKAQFEDAKSVYQTRAALADLRAEIKSVSEAGKAMSTDWGKAFNSIRTMGYGIYSTLTPILVSAAYQIITITDEIDSAYRDMRKTVNATEADYQRLYDAAIEYSTSHVTSASGILEIEAMLAQVGVSFEKLAKTAEVVSNLDIATSLNAEDISTQLGQLTSTMKFGEDEAVNFGDALVRLGNNMATNETQIMDVISYMGSAATMYRFTTDQALAWAAAMASSGQGAEAAGSSFNRVMADIEAAVASGGDGLEGFATVAQMSAEDFAASWKTTPSDAMYAFVKGLADLQLRGESVEMVLQNLGFANVRDKQLLRALTQEVYDAAGGQGVLQDALIMSEDAWNGVSDAWGMAGDAANEANAKAQGFSGTVAMISNNFDALAVKLGDGVTPILQVFLGLLGGLTDAVGSMPTEAVTLLELILGLTAAAGPASVAVGALGSAFVNLRGAVVEYGTSLALNDKKSEALRSFGRSAAEAAGNMNLLETSFKALGNTIRAVAVVALISDLVGKVNECIGAYNDYMDVSYSLSYALRHGSEGFDDASDSAANLASTTEGAVSAAGNAVDGFGSIVDEVTDAFRKIDAQANSLQGAVDTLYQMSGFTVGDMGEGSWESVTAAVDTLNQSLGTNYQAVQDAAGGWRVLDDGIAVSFSDMEKAIEGFRKLKEVSALSGQSDALEENHAALVASNAELREQLRLYGLTDEKIDQVLQTWKDTGGAVLATNPFDFNNDAIEDLVQSLAKTEKATQANEFAQQALDDEYGQAIEQLKQATEATSEYADTTGMSDEQVKQYAETLATAMSGLSSLIQSNGEFSGFLEAQGLSVADFAAQLANAGIDVETFASTYQDYVTKVMDGTNQISDVLADMSADDYLANIQHNLDALASWNDTIAQLRESAAQSWDEMDAAFVEYISGLGPEYATLAQEALNNPEIYAQWKAQLEEAGVLAAESAGQQLEGVKQQVTDSSEPTKLPVELELSGDSATQAVAGMGEQLQQAGTEAGGYVNQGIAQGMADSISTVTDAGNTVAKGVMDSIDGPLEINSPSRQMTQRGMYVDEGLANGIRQGQSTVSSAARQLARSVIDSFGSSRSQAYSVGANIAAGLASGISSGSGAIQAAANSAASSALTSARKTLGIKSPSRKMMEVGDYFVQGFAIGIDRSARVAAESASDMALSAYHAADSRERRVAASSNRLTKADVYDAFSEAMAANAGASDVQANVYIDGRQLAAATARAYDAQLGSISVKKGR